MLYFSETGWTLPDIAEVSTAFDRDYNQVAYEAKIAAIVREVRVTDGAEGHGHPDAWNDALL